MVLIFMRRIYEHETCHALTVFRREDARRETTDRGADESCRSANAAAVEKLRELARDAACGPGRGTRIAVPHSRAVVRADLRESRDLRLDEAPIGARSSQPRLEDDRWRPRTGAPDMKSVSSDIDEPSRRWRGRQLVASGIPLIRGTAAYGYGESSADGDANP